MRRSIRAGLVLCVVLVAGLAKAVCGTPPKARIFPELSHAAPTNTHVWVELPRGFRSQGFCDASSAPCKTGQFEISLESAPIRGRSSRVIAATARESVSGTVATVELVPQTPLEADSRYEIWLRDRSGKHAPQIIGVMRTGKSSDGEKPTWSGLVKSAASPASKPPRTRAPGPVVVTLADECGSPLVVLSAEPARDDSPSEALRYAVWVSDEQGRIDYGKPPLIHMRMDLTSPEVAPGKPRNLFLGNSNAELSDFERPRRKNGFRMGMRAVDWAGHMSEPSEIELP
jgi:hypothetical protein